jgi:hypothetical protein
MQASAPEEGSPVTQNEQRIAALEAENARLRSEVERLKPAPRVVKIDGPFMPPDLEQTERLTRIVLTKYPMLHPDSVRLDPIPMDKYIPMVRSGLIYLASLARMRGKVSRDKQYFDWLLRAGDHINQLGISPAPYGSSLFVAAIATNEVPYSHPRGWPTTADLGVTIGTAGAPAANRWLGILSGSADFDSSLAIEPDHVLHAPRQAHEVMGHTNWRVELRNE